MVEGEILIEVASVQANGAATSAAGWGGLRPKVVHIIPGLHLGGAEMMLYKVLSSKELSCFSHHVISLGDGGILGADFESLGIPVYAIGWRLCAGPGSLLTFCRLIRQLRGDIHQGWLYRGNLAAILAGQVGRGKSTVLWNVMHTPYDLGSEKLGTSTIIRIGALFSKVPQGIIYNAKASAQLHGSIGYRNGCQTVITSGFDLERFKADPGQRRHLRSELGLNASSLLVGLVARYHPVKGHRLFLRAAAILARDFPRLHFVLVGPSGETVLGKLRALIKEEALEGRVHLLGERRDVPAVMAGLDLLISSSLTESFPNVVGEAMACEVPCVVTAVGDCADLVGSTGVVVPCLPEALAAGAAKLIQMNPEARHRLGRAARERIENNYSLPVVAGKYRDLYWDSLRSGPSGGGLDYSI